MDPQEVSLRSPHLLHDTIRHKLKKCTWENRSEYINYETDLYL